jgi:7-cyano-7-deazaguanine synthase
MILKMSKKAVILFSGGLDSTTVLAIAKAQGFQCYALSFDYGQRHRAELQAAQRLAKIMDVVEHKIIGLNLAEIAQSALTDTHIAVPEQESAPNTIPVTYVPARNTVFLALALAWAEVLQAYDIFIGVNAVDYSGYPDCRPVFIQAFNQMANLATKAGVEGHRVKIHTPLIDLSKAQIIQQGRQLGVDYSQTVSCYQADGRGRACGLCDACRLRAAGFAQAHITDTTLYKDK